MNIETLARSNIGKIFIRLLAKAMESRFRYRFFNPIKILQGVDNLDSKAVLEIGCGTGFFTLPAAGLIGEQGCLTSMDILSESVELVSEKVRMAQLPNVLVVKGDALNTKLGAESFNTVLAFGIIPAPMLPLRQLLTEMHRVLKPEGILAVWPPITCWLPKAVIQSGLFTGFKKRNCVYNFKRY